MASGIRVTVAFSDPSRCPIAECSAEAETTISRTSTSVELPGTTSSTTEFLADADVDDALTEGEPRPILSYGSQTLYRVSHGDDVNCPCECLGQYDCPIHRYVADHGKLTLVFHAETFEQLQDVMAEFQERFDGVDVKRVLQPPLSGNPEDRVFVNRGSLTDRQREILETAYREGYFERPKRANATEIASTLGISQSTFTEHLVTAQRKLLGDVFEENA